MTMNNDYQRIERAIDYLARHTNEQPRLERVAAYVGLSEFHFQRLFRRWAGISPKRFLQYLTADHARSLLKTSRSLLDTALETGLSGTGRLHDLTVALHAVTPSDIKRAGAGMIISYGKHDGPFGECFIAMTDRGICALEFGEPAALERLREAWPHATLREQPARTRTIARRLFQPPSHTDTPLNLMVRGTNFQIKVWEALLNIPCGQVVAYEDIARRIGTPSATRAVASAVAKNPVAYLIPCHRVIRKTGLFGEYRWGPKRKRALLAWESARADGRASDLTD